MSNIIYTISGGTPNYEVVLEGTDYLNNHTIEGTYEFSDVSGGTYTLICTDADGCIKETTIIVSDDAINIADESTYVGFYFNYSNGTYETLISPMYQEYDFTSVPLTTYEITLTKNNSKYIDNGDGTFTIDMDLEVKFNNSTTETITYTKPRISIELPFNGLKKMSSSFTPTNSFYPLRVYSTNRIVVEFDDITLNGNTSSSRVIKGIAVANTVASAPQKISINSILLNVIDDEIEISITRSNSVGILTTNAFLAYRNKSNDENLIFNFSDGQLTLTKTVSVDVENNTTASVLLIGDTNTNSPSYIINESNNNGADENNISLTTTTTTTTTTTQQPNPIIFISVRPINYVVNPIGNTDMVFVSPSYLEMFFTTDLSDNEYGTSGVGLSNQATISIGVYGADSSSTQQRISGQNSSTDILNLNPSSTWSSGGVYRTNLVLPVGFKYGKIFFDVKTQITSVTQLFQTSIISNSNIVFAERPLRTEAGTTYGVYTSSSSGITFEHGILSQSGEGEGGGAIFN